MQANIRDGGDFVGMVGGGVDGLGETLYDLFKEHGDIVDSLNENFNKLKQVKTEDVVDKINIVTDALGNNIVVNNLKDNIVVNNIKDNVVVNKFQNVADDIDVGGKVRDVGGKVKNLADMGGAKFNNVTANLGSIKMSIKKTASISPKKKTEVKNDDQFEL